MLFLLIVVAMAPQFLLFLNVRKSALLRFAPVAGYLAMGSGGAAHAARGFCIQHHHFERGRGGGISRRGLFCLGGGSSSAAFAMTLRSLKRPERDGAQPRRSPKHFSACRHACCRIRWPHWWRRNCGRSRESRDSGWHTRCRAFSGSWSSSRCCGDPLPDSFFVQNALPLMALYGLLMLGPITYWNAFGFDRSAVQGYFCWPVRFRDALMAKNIAVAMLLIPQILAIALVGRVARLPASPGKLLRNGCRDIDRFALLVRHGEYLFGANAARDGPGKNEPDGEQAAGSEHLDRTVAAFADRAGLLGAARFSKANLSSPRCCWWPLVIGAIFYKVGLDSAANTADQRRESILLQLSRSDGPYRLRNSWPSVCRVLVDETTRFDRLNVLRAYCWCVLSGR